MTTSLDRHLRVSVDPKCPETLISADRLANVHAIAGMLPASLTEFFGFECRLGENAPTADFLLCIKAAECGREVLAGQRVDEDLPRALLEDPIWQRIVKFAVTWADPQSELYKRVDNVWLEFDMESAVARPAPSLFLGTQALRGQDAVDRAAAPTSRGDCSWLVDAVLVDLLGRPVAKKVESPLYRAFAALPPRASIFQVGAMLSRDVDAIRICVRGLTCEQTSDYIRAVGWPGPSAGLDAFVRDAFADSDSVDLDLDIGEEVGPKIGLECSFLHTASSLAKLRSFLDRLVAKELCTPAKRQGLLDWPGGFHQRSNPQAWPDDLRRRSEHHQGRLLSAFVRWLYHVKLVYEPGRPLHAKAYLAVRQFWPTVETVKEMVAATERAGLASRRPVE